MTTSQNPEHKFPIGSEPNVRTLYLTLAVSAGLAFLGILAIYAWLIDRDPSFRVGYGILVSLLPALAALVFLRLTKRYVSWRGIAIVYVVLFGLLLILQAVGRLIPVFS